jgi:hypothetical protein
MDKYYIFLLFSYDEYVTTAITGRLYVLEIIDQFNVVYKITGQVNSFLKLKNCEHAFYL